MSNLYSMSQGQANLKTCPIYNETRGRLAIPSVMVAETDQDRRLGFQYWPQLLPSDAMLFIFENEDIRAMHMRNVAFPLMMIWLNAKKMVVNGLIAPKSDTLLFSSEYPAQYCIECDPVLEPEFRIGDVIRFTL